METTQSNGRVLDVVSVGLGGTSTVTANTGIGAFGGFLKGLRIRNARYRRAETPAERRA